MVHISRSKAQSKKLAGFSIVELMVAVAVSVLLLAGVVSIFASSRNSYETTDRTSRIQETGRLALDLITRHIRSAGFVGCARQPTYMSTSLRDASDLQWDFLGGPVRGFQFDDGSDSFVPALHTSISSATAGSDVLVVRVPAREAIPLPLLADMSSPAGTLSIANVTSGVRAGDVAIAFSCEAQSVFFVTGLSGGVISHGAGNDTAFPSNAASGGDSLNYTYRRDVTHVLPVETVVYFVAPSTTSPVPGMTSLWRRVALNNAEELVEGVEQMQLQYGIDTNGDLIVDSYVDAGPTTDWQSVISVSVALLVMSLEEYGADRDARTYQLLNVTVPAANDRRLREVFTATATIRNRVRVN